MRDINDEQQTTGGRKAGRPPKFNRDQVLERLLVLFWTQGYEETSVADMVKVAGVNPPTLYASFGSKEDVFHLVMERYIERHLAPVMASIQATDKSVIARIEQFLIGFVQVVTQQDLPRGCLFLFEMFTYHKKPLPELARLQASSATFAEAFLAMIEAGIAAGEFAMAGDGQEIMTLILTFEKGLAMQAKAGSSQQMLVNIVRRFVGMLSGKRLSGKLD